MEILIFALNAVLPLILLMALGYFLKKIKLISNEFLSKGNKLCFYCALPVLLFKNLYDAEFVEIPWKLIVFVIICIIAIFILSLVYVILFVKDNKQKGVMIQGFMRSNYAFIGIPLATALFEAGSPSEIKAGTCVALISVFCIPLFNMLSVVALSLFVDNKDNKVDYKKILVNIAKNPLIIGIFFGILVLLFRKLVPDSTFFVKNNLPFLYKFIANVSSIATPLALIILGGQFEFNVISDLKKQIITAVIGRTIIVPILVFTTAILLNCFKDYEFAVLIAAFASPVAIVSQVMAKEMNNDYVLAGQLVVWTTVVSSFTIFIIVVTLKSLGYL